MAKDYKMIIGAQDPTDSGLARGLYIFSKKEGFFDRSSLDDGADQYIEIDGKRMTPRTLKANQKALQILTRTHIMDCNGENISYKKKKATDPEKILEPTTIIALEDLLSTLPEQKRKELLANPTYWMEKSLEGLFISLFLADQAADKFKEGVLLYSSSGKIEDLKLIPECIPTGPVIPTADRTAILVPRMNRCLRYQFRQGQVNLTDNIPLQGNILALDDKYRTTVITGNDEDWFITSTGRKILPPERGLLDDVQPSFEQDSYQAIPSEATTVGLARYQNKEYVLLGVDDGRLLLWEIVEAANNNYIPQHIKTVNFLSLEKIALEGGKEMHLRDLRIDDNGWVSFMLANLFIRTSMTALLELSPDQRIDAVNERNSGDKGYLDYLSTMKTTYHLDQICAVPHRATSYEMLETE